MLSLKNELCSIFISLLFEIGSHSFWMVGPLVSFLRHFICVLPDLHLQRNFCFSLVLKSVLWTRPDVSFSFIFELYWWLLGEFLCQATSLSFRRLYCVIWSDWTVSADPQVSKYAGLEMFFYLFLALKKSHFSNISMHLHHAICLWSDGVLFWMFTIRCSVAHSAVNCDTLFADYLGFSVVDLEL